MRSLSRHALRIAILILLLNAGLCHGSVTRYVSFSMPRETLLEAMRFDPDESDRRILFRGLPEDGGYPQFIEHLMPLLKGVPQESWPRISIDPRAFESQGINAVPVTETEGILDRRHARYRIGEPDPRVMMLQALRHRTKAEWRESLLKGGIRTKSIDLPKALQESRITLSPAYRLPRPLLGGDGDVLMTSDRILNPLERLPTAISIMVVDPNDQRQVTRLKERWDSLPENTHILMGGIIPGEIHTATPPLMEGFGQPLFTLPDHWIQRLRITALPVEIRSRNGHLEIHQWVP